MCCGTWAAPKAQLNRRELPHPWMQKELAGMTGWDLLGLRDCNSTILVKWDVFVFPNSNPAKDEAGS